MSKKKRGLPIEFTQMHREGFRLVSMNLSPDSSLRKLKKILSLEIS